MFGVLLLGCTPSKRFDFDAAVVVAHPPPDAHAVDAALGSAADAAAPSQDATPQDAAARPPHPKDALDAGQDDDGGPTGPRVRGMPVADFFRDTCGGCHGPNRQGGICPTLIPARFDKPKSFYFNTIKNGRPGTLMPTWGGTNRLTDTEIGYLVDFVFTEPALSSVKWGLDEIIKSRTVAVADKDLATAPTHTGNLDNLMLVTERDSRSFAVIDGDTHTVLGHVAASYRAHGYAFDPTGNRWVYNLGRDGWLFKVDLYTLKSVIAVRIGIDARGVAISDDGKYIIAGNFLPNTAVILEAATLMPLKVIETAGINPDGKFVGSRVAIVSDVAPKLVGPYFILGLKDAGQVWRIDWSKPDFPIVTLDNVGRLVHDGFLSPDNRQFYIASQQDNWMAVIDVARWKLVNTLPTGTKPHTGSGATWTTGNTTYAATVHGGEGKISIWETGSGRIVRAIPTRGPGLFLRSHGKSPYVWADAVFGDPANEITVFDQRAPGFDVVARITDGAQTLHPEFTADAKYVYVADWSGNVVRVYDARYDPATKTFPLIKTIDGIKAPTGIFSVERRSETLGH